MSLTGHTANLEPMAAIVDTSASSTGTGVPLAQPVRCPQASCGALMIARRTEDDEEDFLSCSRYPHCWGMRRMDGTRFCDPRAIFQDSRQGGFGYRFVVMTVRGNVPVRMYQCQACHNFSVRSLCNDAPRNIYSQCEVLPCSACWPETTPRPFFQRVFSDSTSAPAGHNV